MGFQIAQICIFWWDTAPDCRQLNVRIYNLELNPIAVLGQYANDQNITVPDFWGCVKILRLDFLLGKGVGKSKRSFLNYGPSHTKISRSLTYIYNLLMPGINVSKS